MLPRCAHLAPDPAFPAPCFLPSLLPAAYPSLRSHPSVLRARLTRRNSRLRVLVEQFRPGDVDELIAPDAPRRTLVHSGILSKSTKVARVPRHYFLFSDGALLTAEVPKSTGGRVMGAAGSAFSRGSSLMSALGGGSGSRPHLKAASSLSASGGGAVLAGVGGGAGGEAGGAPLRKCKWLSLSGATVHVPPGSDPSYFEITYSAEAGKTNHLWAESADQKRRWLRRLLQVMQRMSFNPPPPPPPRPRCTATDRAVRARMRARVACYSREASLLRGGWHAAALSPDTVPLTTLLKAEAPRAANAEALLGATPLHVAVEAGNAPAVEALLRAAASLAAPPLLELADHDGLTPLYVAALCLCEPHPSHAAATPSLAPSSPPQSMDDVGACRHGAAYASHGVFSSVGSIGSVGSVGSVASSCGDVGCFADAAAASAAASASQPSTTWLPQPAVSVATRLSILRSLLDAGASVEGGCEAAAIDSPLLMCIGAGALDAVTALRGAGADGRDLCRGTVRLPVGGDGGGVTAPIRASALQLAILTRQPATVRSLLASGVGCAPSPAGGRTLPTHAPVAVAFPSSAPPLPRPLAFSHALVPLPRPCLRSVAPPPGEPSALHFACRQPVPDPAILTALLDHAAQPNLPDPNGCRPLQLLPTMLGTAASLPTSPPHPLPPPPPPPPPPPDPSSASPTGAAASPSPPPRPSVSAAADEGADILADVCACVEALVLAGARLEPPAAPFASPQVHPSLLHVAKATAAKVRAEGKDVPRLQPVAHSALSANVHAQLGAHWVEDKTVTHCMGCAAAFTSMVRRHHCRMLGIVVCDACSSRRAVLPSAHGTGGVRVCDAAFNVVRHLGRLAQRYDLHTGAEKTEEARRAHEFLAAEMQTLDETARLAANRAELLRGGGAGGAGSSSSSSGGAGGGSGSSSSSARATKAACAAHEAVDALHERGEKLGMLNDKVAAMGDEAESFADMAKKLRQQAEKSSRWLPF